MTPAYFEFTSPTYLENWSEGLKRLSIPQNNIRLNLEEVRFLTENRIEDYCLTEIVDSPKLNRLRNFLAENLARFAEGAFVRLGSKSPKDSPLAWRYGLNAKDAIQTLAVLVSSKRIQEDLQLAFENQYRPHLFVRQWLDIAPWAEFRCFMNGQKLIGITQYTAEDSLSYSEITENSAAIEKVIRRFFVQLQKASTLDNAVYDVFVESKDFSSFKVWLLEINPFFSRTDACLFNWQKKNDFDGSFRFLKN